MATLVSPSLVHCGYSTCGPKPYHRDSNYSNKKIRCGPRDGRGKLQRGRVLSSEAVLAVQSLKRASARGHLHQALSPSLSRLLVADLIASLRELLRQDLCALALSVLSAARSDPSFRPDLSLYADFVSALSRNRLLDESDRLVSDLLAHHPFDCSDLRGLARLLKALVAAERTKSVVDVYRAMKRDCCLPDEFIHNILTKGLRRLGEHEVADEVERDFASAV